MIEINQYIDRDWLPEHGCFLENFPELKMEEKRGTRYYYEKLLDAAKKGNQPVNMVLKEMSGSAGNGNGTVQLPNGQIVQIPNHDWENIMEGLSDASKKLIETQTEHLIKQIADQVQKSRGTIPSEFVELLEKLNKIEPAKFDWKGYIRRFVGKSTKTYTKTARRKLNKRMIDFPGLKIKQQKHILAAIDTSGSISTSELKEFLNELYHLKKTGSEVTIIECDSAIKSISKFDSRKDLEIVGRGGTDFQPVIDYYNEHMKQYSCLIYFTDGEAPVPENARGNILWVLSEQSKMKDDLPGSVIKLTL